MISFTCPECAKELTAPDGAAGRDGRCPCGCVFVIPPPDNQRPASHIVDHGGHTEPDDGEDDAALERLLRRRRDRRASRRLVLRLALCAVLLVAAVVAVTAAVNRWRQAHQAADDQGRTATPEPKPERVEPKPRANPPATPRAEPEGTIADLRPAPTPPGPDRPTVVRPRPPVVTNPVEIPPPAGLPHPGGTPPPTPGSATPKPPFKSDRPAKEVFPGYYLRTPEKFTVYVSRLAYEQSDEADGEPLKVVDEELARIAEIFPEASLKALRTVPVWVEWDHTIPRSARAFGVYYGKTGDTLWTEGVDPRKAGCVCVLPLKAAHQLRAKKKARQNVLLHEFGHVIHDKVFGFDNPFIRNAYDQAVPRGLYARVKHDNGTEGAAYAVKSRNEYFAELTCAYLDRLDYPPHDAKELREYDSVGYELMTKAYGTPEEIAKAKKKTPEGKKK